MSEFSAKNYGHVLGMFKTIENMLKIEEKPEIGIICGSGLAKIADMIEIKTVLPYEKVPNLPKAKGELISMG
jgi:purine nucleoside phosphorylase